MSWALDLLVILRMRPCDVFICMSGMYVQAPRFAKWRYGAGVIVHRGSSHILSQRDILAQSLALAPGAQQVTPFAVRRELKSYAVADRIAVPSTQVVDSFSQSPELVRKLVLSPYGVDLDAFPMRTGTWPSDPHFAVRRKLVVSKGADVLVEAVEAMDGVRLNSCWSFA